MADMSHTFTRSRPSRSPVMLHETAVVLVADDCRLPHLFLQSPIAFPWADDLLGAFLRKLKEERDASGGGAAAAAAGKADAAGSGGDACSSGKAGGDTGPASSKHAVCVKEEKEEKGPVGPSTGTDTTAVKEEPGSHGSEPAGPGSGADAGPGPMDGVEAAEHGATTPSKPGPGGDTGEQAGPGPGSEAAAAAAAAAAAMSPGGGRGGGGGRLDAVIANAEKTGRLALPLGIFLCGLICSGPYTNTQVGCGARQPAVQALGRP